MGVSLANGLENSRNLSGPEKEMVSAFGSLLSAIQNAEQICATKLSIVQSDGTTLSPSPLLITVDTGEGDNPASDKTAGNREFQQARQLLREAIETFGRRVNNIIGSGTEPNQGGNTFAGGGLSGSQNPGRSLQLGRDPTQRAIYAGVAFADERMLAFDWLGRQDWLQRPLESELSGSRSAGQQIFRHIEELKVGALGDRGLAVLYLSMLNLGFAGMYVVDDAQGKLRVYRRALFQFLTYDAPDLDKAADQLLDSGRNVQTSGTLKFLPYLRPWVIGGIGIVLAFILANQYLWFINTEELKIAIDQLARQMGY